MGQVPTILSLPLPLQGDRREEPPDLFPIYSSSRGTPGSRDRLSPGPRWGLWPALLPGRNAPSRPSLCNSPGQRGRGCQPHPPPPPPPFGRHYLPRRALACPGEDRSTHLHAHGAGPLCFKHTPLSAPSLGAQLRGGGPGLFDTAPLPLATKVGGEWRGPWSKGTSLGLLSSRRTRVGRRQG